jgi:hypothetical protein
VNKSPSQEFIRHFATHRLLLALFNATLASAVVVATGLDQQTTNSRRAIHDGQFQGQSGTITNALARSEGDLVLRAEGSQWKTPHWNTADKLLEMYACNSSAVVVAVPKKAEPVISAHKGTVYTTWQMMADDVLKAPSATRIPWQSTIEVLTHGGTVTVDGRKVTVVHPMFPAMTLGNPYLLFLRRISETGAFVPYLVIDVGAESPKAFPEGELRFLERQSTLDLLVGLKDRTIPLVLASDLCATEPLV